LPPLSIFPRPPPPPLKVLCTEENSARIKVAISTLFNFYRNGSTHFGIALSPSFEFFLEESKEVNLRE
jgi:hypothetical protein